MPEQIPTYPASKEIIEKINSFKISDHKKFEDFLMDTANSFYDVYEYVVELEDRITTLNKHDLQMLSERLPILKNEAAAILDSLIEIRFRSKNMFRIQDELETIEEDVPGLLKRIKKLI